MEINKVAGFNPEEYATIIEKEGEKCKYLEVKYRKLWFLLKYPNGVIRKKIVTMNENQATVEAKVYADRKDSLEEYLASGYATRRFSDEFIQSRYLEIAETAAEGRALAGAGFGLQFVSELDDDEKNQFCDAPFTINKEPEQTKEDKTQFSEMSQENPLPEHPVSEVICKDEGNTVSLPQGVVPLPEKPQTQNNTGALTLQEAKGVVCDFGIHKRKTLGEIAMIPDRGFHDLNWIATKYNGKNERAKLGAKKLLETARAS